MKIKSSIAGIAAIAITVVSLKGGTEYLKQKAYEEIEKQSAQTSEAVSSFASEAGGAINRALAQLVEDVLKPLGLQEKLEKKATKEKSLIEKLLGILNAEDGDGISDVGLTDTRPKIEAEQKIEDSKDDYLFHEGTLIRVIDGDTLIVSIDGEETTIRLIGVDTPESVNPDESKNTIYGTYASGYTKDLLKESDTLYLQYDEGKEDKYGRTLAYVWLRKVEEINAQSISNYMVNGMLVRNGYAVPMTIEPNVSYADIFTQLEDEAKESNAGLWSYEEYRQLEGET